MKPNHCKNCGKVIARQTSGGYKYSPNDYQRLKFCSYGCANEFRNKKPKRKGRQSPLKCRNCGKVITDSKWFKTHYCGLKCWQEAVKK